MSKCPDENALAIGLESNDPKLHAHLEECESCRLCALAFSEVLAAGAVLEPQDGPMHEGRFELLRLLGRGGFSLVWEARELTTGHTVALKIVEDELGAAAARRAIREARGLSEMDCPYILKAREAFRTVDGRIAIVADLLHGEDLGSALERGGGLGEARTRQVLAQIALGLTYAHARGVVHRDLKPRNVFLEAPTGNVRILDFGMAKWMDSLGLTSKLTKTGTVLGTPNYMSPEQISGDADVGAATDVWSLGVLGIETLTGKSPIEGRSFGRIFRTVTTGAFPRLREAAPDASAELAELIDAMLATDATARPTAAEVAGMLGAAPTSCADPFRPFPRTQT